MVPLFGVPMQAPSKYFEEEEALALCDCRLIKTPNNQPRVSGSGRGDVIAEADGGGSVGGKHRPIVWGGKWNKNIYIMKNTSWLLAASDQR